MAYNMTDFQNLYPKEAAQIRATGVVPTAFAMSWPDETNQLKQQFNDEQRYNAGVATTAANKESAITSLRTALQSGNAGLALTELNKSLLTSAEKKQIIDSTKEYFQNVLNMPEATVNSQPPDKKKLIQAEQAKASGYDNFIKTVATELTEETSQAIGIWTAPVASKPVLNTTVGQKELTDEQIQAESALAAAKAAKDKATAQTTTNEATNTTQSVASFATIDDLYNAQVAAENSGNTTRATELRNEITRRQTPTINTTDITTPKQLDATNQYASLTDAELASQYAQAGNVGDRSLLNVLSTEITRRKNLALQPAPKPVVPAVETPGKKSETDPALIREATNTETQSSVQRLVLQQIADAIRDNQIARKELLNRSASFSGQTENDIKKLTGKTPQEIYEATQGLTDSSINKITGGSYNDLYSGVMNGWKDTLAQGQQYAQKYAQDQSELQTNVSTRKAIQGARTAGVSGAQAAQMASGAAGDMYNANYTTNYGAGLNNYIKQSTDARQAGLDLVSAGMKNYQSDNTQAQTDLTTGLNQINTGRNQELAALAAAAGVPIEEYKANIEAMQAASLTNATDISTASNETSKTNTNVTTQAAMDMQDAAIASSERITKATQKLQKDLAAQSNALTQQQIDNAWAMGIENIKSTEKIANSALSSSQLQTILNGIIGVGSAVSSYIPKSTYTQSLPTAKGGPSVASGGVTQDVETPDITPVKSGTPEITPVVNDNTTTYSDKNLKENITDGKTSDILKKLRSVKYNYKGEPVERVGILAQDLEKTPLKSTVTKDANGMRMVDTGQLTLANTAMLSDIEKKLQELEKKFSKSLEYVSKGRK